MSPNQPVKVKLDRPKYDIVSPVCQHGMFQMKLYIPQGISQHQMGEQKYQIVSAATEEFKNKDLQPKWETMALIKPALTFILPTNQKNKSQEDQGCEREFTERTGYHFFLIEHILLL